MKKLLDEFKEFIMRGNVLDLSVGVVIGSAFTAIVNGIVDGLITPLIGLVVGLISGGTDLESSLSVLDWAPINGVTFSFGSVLSALITFLITGWAPINGVTFSFGSVLSALITFLITGFVLFLIVKAVNTAQRKVVKKEEELEAEAPQCPYCKQEVAEGATRCPHCTSELPEPAQSRLPEIATA